MENLSSTFFSLPGSFLFLKGDKKCLKRKKTNITINSSLASRLPYSKCYEEEGIIQTKDGRYTKMYIVEDIKPENISDFK